MAVQQNLVKHSAMATVVALHIFGGDKPLVSQTIAVTVALIQFMSLLGDLIAFPIACAPSKVARKMEEDAMRPLSGLRFVQGLRCVEGLGFVEGCFLAAAPKVAWLTTRVAPTLRSTRFHYFMGVSLVLLITRLLRFFELLPTATVAVPLAAVFGLMANMLTSNIQRTTASDSNLFECTSACSWQEDNEEDEKLNNETLEEYEEDAEARNDDCHHGEDFWSGLKKQDVQSEEETMMSSSEILSDVLWEMSAPDHRVALPQCTAPALNGLKPVWLVQSIRYIFFASLTSIVIRMLRLGGLLPPTIIAAPLAYGFCRFSHFVITRMQRKTPPDSQVAKMMPGGCADKDCHCDGVKCPYSSAFWHELELPAATIEHANMVDSSNILSDVLRDFETWPEFQPPVVSSDDEDEDEPSEISSDILFES